MESFYISQLCVICENVDLDSAVRDPTSFPGLGFGERWIALESLANIRPDCQLCKYILERIKESLGDKRIYGISRRVTVRCFDASPCAEGFSLQFSMPGLEIGIGSEDSRTILNIIAIQKLDFKLLRTLPTEKIDYEGVQKALSVCQRQHGSSCKYGPRRADLTFLRVIDCSSRSIVAVANRPFVALSYVWGSQIDAESDKRWRSELNYRLPETIEDAIFVAEKIGIGSLWVDRYCIDQSNDDDVRRHIANMDQIYQRAAITIIDGAGSNPDHGLPGVSTNRPRRRLKEVSLSGFEFVETGMGIPFLLRHSTWQQRGWTFQEALFSRRRLVFTEQMVYFECGSMSWTETESTTTSRSPAPDPIRTEERFLPLFPNSTHSCSVNASAHLVDYTNRILTKPNDVLLAISGVFHAFENNGSGFKHHWGLPIFPNMEPCDTRHAFDVLLVEIPPHAWNTTVAFSFALAWRPEWSSTRRKGFPSWSWCGWFAPIHGFPWQALSQPSLAPSFTKLNTCFEEMSIKIELLNGEIVDWNEISNYEPSVRQDMVSTYLHLTAYTTFVTVTPHESCHALAEIQAEANSGYRCSLEMFPSSSEPLPRNALIIHLVQTQFAETSRQREEEDHQLLHRRDKIPWPQLLVVAKSNGEYERIGTTYRGIRVWNSNGDEVVKWPRLWDTVTDRSNWQLEDPTEDPEIPPEQLQGYEYLRKELKTLRLG